MGNGDARNLLDALGAVLADAKVADAAGDEARASALFEVVADLARQLGERWASGLEAEGLQQKAQQYETAAEGLLKREIWLGEREETKEEKKAPSALIWKATERDMRVFFYRNLPEIYEGFRFRYEKARAEGDWEQQWASFRGLGDLFIMLSQLKLTTRSTPTVS
jgi:hypothetical protein